VSSRASSASGADQRQLPGEVDRVLDAGVHALAGGGAVEVRGVAGQQHPVVAVARDLSVVDLE
jgi:hypothetical protein